MATYAERWLESLDPGATPAENPTDLRRIGLALRSLADNQREVDEAVAAARENGRRWGEIGLVLGSPGKPPASGTASPPLGPDNAYWPRKGSARGDGPRGLPRWRVPGRWAPVFMSSVNVLKTGSEEFLHLLGTR